jgi:hypothetical protein
MSIISPLRVFITIHRMNIKIEDFGVRLVLVFTQNNNTLNQMSVRKRIKLKNRINNTKQK